MSETQPMNSKTTPTHILLEPGEDSTMLDGPCTPTAFHDGFTPRAWDFDGYRRDALVLAADNTVHRHGCLALADNIDRDERSVATFRAVLGAVWEAISENEPARLQALVTAHVPSGRLIFLNTNGKLYSA